MKRKQVAGLIPKEFEMGAEYEDSITGFKGRATAIYLFMHGCARVNLVGRRVDSDGNVTPEECQFDAPQLVRVADVLPDTGGRLKVKETGGDGSKDFKRQTVTR